MKCKWENCTNDADGPFTVCKAHQLELEKMANEPGSFDTVARMLKDGTL